MGMLRHIAVGSFVGLTISGRALAEPPPSGSCGRPLSEGNSWVTLGGGVREARSTTGVFELGGGSQITFPLSSSGDVRLGAFGQLSAGNFDTGWAGVGPVLYITSAPADLDMFQWRGNGVFSVRLLGGTSWGGDDYAVPVGTPIFGTTVSWGYRAPFDLRHDFPCDRGACESDTPCRAAYRYFTGVRLFVSTHYAAAGEGGWQATTGIELEPVGSFRYLFALY